MSQTQGVGRTPRIGRAGWNLTDQALSAGTNFAMSFVIARNVSAEEFGQFSVAFLIFSLVVGVQRALVGTPLSMRYSALAGVERRLAASDAFSAVLLITLPVSAGLLITALFSHGSMRSVWLVLAVFLPLLIGQDACRMAFFAWGRPQLATLNDATWALVQFSMIALVLGAGYVSAASMVFTWGFAAGIAAILGVWQLQAVPRLRRGWGWISSNRSVSGYLLAEYVFGIGAFQGGILLLGAFLGVADVGSLRAAQVLTGPLAIIASAVTAFGIPEISRHGLPPRPLRVAIGVSAGLVAIALVYAAVLMAIPESLGMRFLGDTWTGASEVLLPIALASVAASAKLGPVTIVYGLGHASRTFRLEAVLAVCAVVFMFLGARQAGVTGLAWGMCAAQLVVVPLWFRQAHRCILLGPDASSPLKAPA